MRRNYDKKSKITKNTLTNIKKNVTPTVFKAVFSIREFFAFSLNTKLRLIPKHNIDNTKFILAEDMKKYVISAFV